MRVQGFQERVIGEGIGPQIVQDDGGLSAVMGQRVRARGGQVHGKAQLLRKEAAGRGLAHARFPIGPDNGAVPLPIGRLGPGMVSVFPGAAYSLPVLGVDKRVNVGFIVIGGNGPVRALFYDFI